MWTTRDQLNARGTARPLRVAYLVDAANCPHALLDSIFAEAYSRWGGRQTLIVPAEPDGIDGRYGDWLWYFDADLIYSYVDLTDEAVAEIHERYAPTYLTKNTATAPGTDAYFHRPNLAVDGLSSLSILPALLSRTWGVIGPKTKLLVVSKYWDKSESSFLEENFGFVGKSFQPPIASSTPELFACLTLISEEARDNPTWAKDPNATYVTDEQSILEELGRTGANLTTLANLSNFLAPRLETASALRAWTEGISLIVGDTINDRLLFWNGNHHYNVSRPSELASVRVPAERLTDEGFLTSLKRILRARGKYNFQGRNDYVILRSCSVSQETLERVAELLRKKDGYLAVKVEPLRDHSACIPMFDGSTAGNYAYNPSYNEGRAIEHSEFQGARLQVPRSIPWHLREERPPAALRQGYWMVDLSIERSLNHSRFSNVQHIWQFPRRIAIELAFKLDRPDSDVFAPFQNTKRVVRSGLLSMPARLDEGQTAFLSIPDDIDAFRYALAARWEWWTPFDRVRKDAPQGRTRFRYAEISDKGRYLLAVLERFDSLDSAFEVLMSHYWREIFVDLGALPVEKNPSLRAEFLTTLRKRLRQPEGELTFGTDAEVDRLAREAIRSGRMVQREKRFVGYRKLLKAWLTLLAEFEKRNPPADGEDNEFYRDRTYLDRSIQHLCATGILFQGREWRCARCYNRNWDTIGSIGSVLRCGVCGRSEPAPVSGDWHFRLNDFVIEAYRDHGTEAVIYTLWRLWNRAQITFYFAPSLKLWLDYPEVRGAKNVEIDALIVVDGSLYLVEAKNSGGLTQEEIAKLVSAAELVRPDFLVLGFMEADFDAGVLVAKLRSKLPSQINVEVICFDAAQLDQNAILPS